ncbi:MAG: endonuclease [Bacteroidetes bacterium]|nr:endonuclease [Bacteroidota bacterium]HCI70334.1 endonuclease [Balneola sp.]
MNKGYVYFLTTYRRTTNYIGVTNNIPLSSSSVTLGRMFCKKCTSETLALVGVLVYAEEYDNISDAIAREKQLKNWHKQWKWNLVKQNNPTLEDWYDTLRGW